MQPGGSCMVEPVAGAPTYVAAPVATYALPAVTYAAPTAPAAPAVTYAAPTAPAVSAGPPTTVVAPAVYVQAPAPVRSAAPVMQYAAPVVSVQPTPTPSVGLPTRVVQSIAPSVQAEPVAGGYSAPAVTTYAAPLTTSTYAAPAYMQQAQPQYIQQPHVQYIQQPQVVMQQPQYRYQQPQVIMQQPQVVMQQGMVGQPGMQQIYLGQPGVRIQGQPMAHPIATVADGPPMTATLTNSKDRHVADGEPVQKTGAVHALITGIDYACDSQSWAGPPPHGHGPLDTKYAFDMMIDLCNKSEVTTLTTLWNEQCTIQNMVNTIVQVGMQCGPGDTFVFYYTGHGDQLPNPDAAIEGEAMDQCFCTVDDNGNTDDPTMRLREQVWMRDDVFARAVLDATQNGGTALVLCDCCHSGSICDFTPHSEWARRKQPAISISGCEDSQTSAGTGKGGRFTRAMTMAIQDQNGKPGYNVATIFNRALDEYKAHKSAAHTQNISIHGCVVRPHNMAWPLQPKGDYISPANTVYRGLA